MSDKGSASSSLIFSPFHLIRKTDAGNLSRASFATTFVLCSCEIRGPKKRPVNVIRNFHVFFFFFFAFQMLLREHYDKFPILILKDIKYQELQAMMNYMYRGEVNITQETLGSFLKAAESLQIRGLTDNTNCVDNNNGMVRDTSSSHGYHASKKAMPDSRKIVVPSTPLISQQRSRSPTMVSQPTKKYLKSPIIVENHHANNNSKSIEPVENNSPSIKRRKLLPPIKSEGLVVTPINPSTSTYNHLDVSSVCEVPSQPQSIPAVEGKANVPSPSVPPKIESPHMDITPVITNKIPMSVGNGNTNPSEALIKPKPMAELVKVKNEQLDDSYNEDTNDDSYTTEDNDNDRDENSHLSVGLSFQNNQSGISEFLFFSFSPPHIIISSYYWLF